MGVTRRVLARVLIVCVALQGSPFLEATRAAGMEPMVRRTAGATAAREPAAAGAGASVSLFGPKDYVRKTGKPFVVTDTFDVGQPVGRVTLRIDNGGRRGQYDRVSSAVVTLNGVVVVAPHDFNQQLPSTTRTRSALANRWA